MPEVQYKVDLPAFTGRNVPIKEIAQAMGKDAQYVRVGLQQGILKFGTAIKVGNSNEFSYYCREEGMGRDRLLQRYIGSGIGKVRKGCRHRWIDISVWEVANIHRRSLLLCRCNPRRAPADLAQTMAHWM